MARKSNDRWTDEDDQRLLAMRAVRKSNVVIAAALRRTEASVVGRIYVLKKRAAAGGKLEALSASKRAWSFAVEQRLSELIATGKSISDLAAAMGRTEAAIENRIHVIKHRASAS
jgi:hypothetical protein